MGTGLVFPRQPRQRVGQRQRRFPGQGQSLLACAQQVQVGRQCRGLGGVAQRRIHCQPSHPRPGVAHGGQGVQQSGQTCGLPHGVFQPVLQAFGYPAHRGKGGLLCAGCPQQCQLAVPHDCKIRILSVIFRLFIQFQRLLRHIRCQRRRAALRPECPQGAGAGKGCMSTFGQCLPVVCALPGQGDGLHFYILFYDGLTILYGKIVVGLVQQGGDV